MTRLLSAVLALLLASLAATAPARAAANSAAGTGGATFLQLGYGDTRAIGMGRAFVAVAEGTDSLTWNPAGLGITSTREFSYSYMRYVQGVDSPVYMAYAHPLGRTVLGANFAYLSVNGFDVRNAQGVPLDNSNVTVKDGFGGVSVARSFFYEKLFAGATLKDVYEDNAGARRNSMALDFGLIFKPNHTLSFGFATQNLGPSNDRVAKVTRLGVAARLFEYLLLSTELSKPSDNGWKAGIGGEFVLPEELLSVGQVSLRMGYYSRGDEGTILNQDRSSLYPLVGANGLSFGLGVFTSQAFGYGIGLDYALVPMGALGTTDELTLKVKF
jgi:hypothetical protein